MSHQLGFLQRLKASFTFCAMKHSGDFCFTSVIAYNSMKLQPELVSLAADKQSCECGTVLVHGEGGMEGGSPSQATSLGYPSGKAAGILQGMQSLVTDVTGFGQKRLGKGLKLGINTWVPCPGHPQPLIWGPQF